MPHDDLSHEPIGKTISDFDRHLSERGLRFRCVLVGSAPLILRGTIRRVTRDCDVLHPKIPSEIQKEAAAFAATKRAAGIFLEDSWLNNGPESLKDILPKGWEHKTEAVFTGKALHLQCLDRMNVLRIKLFAFCDRGDDRADCMALKPTARELSEAYRWVVHQDANQMWPEHCRQQFAELARELGLRYELRRSREHSR